MAAGLLEVTGTLDYSQYWPTATSDADTTKVQIAVTADSFRFRSAPGKSFRVTHAFENATVIGTTRKAPISDKGIVTVRLQGIDAPELHYRPQAALKRKDQSDMQHEIYLKWNLDYRQYFGETATVALVKRLEKFAAGPLRCKVLSAIDEPNEAFDTYGRLVGDIVVTKGQKKLNINQWLLSEGWVVPTFYSSMSNAEILKLIDLATKARNNEKGLWNRYVSRVLQFEWDLVFRGKGAAIDDAADKDAVTLPKLFRRQAAYEVNKRARMVAGSFVNYLRKKRDEVHELNAFLSQGPQAAPVRNFDEFLSGNAFTAAPEALVFREKQSDLKGPGGQPVHW